MTINRRTLLEYAGLSVAAVGATVLPAGTAAAIELHGSKLNWRAELPAGWIGGTASEIENVMRKTTGNDKTSRDIRKITQSLLAEAKNLDLVFIHTDTTAAKRLTMLKSNVLKLSIDLKDSAARGQLWQAFGKSTNDEQAGAGVVKVEDDKTSTTGGRPAYTGVLRTDLKAGGGFYTVLHLVDQGGGNWHLLNLEADSIKYPLRSKEFDGMLKSIRYSG
jgi:hypothetical protein